METAARITQFRLRRHMLGAVLLALALVWALLLAAQYTVQAGEPTDARPGPPVITASPAVNSTFAISLPMETWPQVTETGSWLPSWVRSLQNAGDVSQVTGPVVVSKTAPEEISLGERVEYGLVISNTGDQAANVLVYDVLPIPIYEGEADCYPDCTEEPEVMTMTVTTPSRYGAPPSTLVVRVVYRISWENVVVPPGEYREIEFSIPVTGKGDGMSLKNRAYIRYTLADGTQGTSMSNETETLVSIDVEPTSSATLSQSPVWFSEDYGGSGSVDWGDFDRDGNLDLAVGGSQGTTIYRNLGGQLTRFWNTETYSHDLHWIDVDGDDTLELVAIGYHWWTSIIDNHIYKRSPDGARFDEIGPSQLSTAPLLQVTPADLDADGDLDLVALTAERWTTDDCAFRFYRNDGDLYSTPYTCLAAPKRDYAKTSEDIMALGDYDNDDDLDLVLDVWDLENPDPGAPCLYRDLLWLMPNSNGHFTGTAPLLLDTFIHCAWPVHATWGDYDRDGDLDLAAVLPVLTGSANHQVRIYRNLWIEGAGGGSPFADPITLELPREQPPYSAAWSDFDGDGDLDLAVAGAPFRIYLNESGSFASDRFISPQTVTDFALDMAVADYNGDSTTDVALANPFGPTTLFSTLAPRLNRTMDTIAVRPASSVVWGDADGESTLDLVFGATATSVNADLYYNVFGLFPSRLRYESSGFGPHGLAYGDLDADGNLDLAFSTPAGVQVYLSGHLTEPDWSVPLLGAQAVAWGDADADGDLDLAVGTNGYDLLFLNDEGALNSTPALTFPRDDDTRSLAWADYNGDRYLDLATGNYDGPAGVYQNNRDGTFTLAWVTSRSWKTTNLAWGDYDHDGDLDLALGNDGQANVLYQNDAGVLGQQPIWTAPVVRHTTSLAWGDWNNDGDPDLAIGNAGEPDQVYLNRDSQTGVPRLAWIWSSAESYPTTGVAWGDRDSDGDLDLAISTETKIGFYENQTILPAHLTGSFLPSAPLPDNPPYLAVDRPGETRNAFFLSSAETLSGPDHPTVTVEYRLFDPDGTRQGTGNAPGDQLARTLFQFSLDGGGTWQTATSATISAPLTTTLRLGQAATFIWDPIADQAISDDARFRVGIIPSATTGSSQRGITWAVSPPFRVQGTTCIWPIHPAIIASDLHPDLGENVSFQGTVEQASGVLTFLWDFGDGSTDQGQLVYHRFQRNGIYNVRLTIRSEPCPIPKELVVNQIIRAGTGAASIYLPNVLKVYP